MNENFLFFIKENEPIKRSVNSIVLSYKRNKPRSKKSNYEILKDFKKNNYVFCSLCKVFKASDVHHINSNHYDDSVSNLTLLCRLCHKRTHKGVTTKLYSSRIPDKYNMLRKRYLEKSYVSYEEKIINLLREKNNWTKLSEIYSLSNNRKKIRDELKRLIEDEKILSKNLCEIDGKIFKLQETIYSLR